jgi:biopolymer transport protein ExbB/TolQ
MKFREVGREIENFIILTRFEVLFIVIMQIIVFWDVMLCSLVIFTNVSEEHQERSTRLWSVTSPPQKKGNFH